LHPPFITKKEDIDIIFKIERNEKQKERLDRQIEL